MSKIGLIFPGQGSQFVGMAKELMAASEVARKTVEQADQILGFALSRIMLEGPEDELKQTAVAQPAILTASLAAYAALTEHWKPAPSEVIAAGHSLGEYSALCAAGVLDFASCLRLVRKRGQLMQETAKQVSGGMAAVIGKTESEVRDLCQQADPENIQIANLNCPGQIVVSGSNQALDVFYNLAKEQNVRFMPLAVSGPFHSRFMQPAADQLAADLAAAPFKDAKFPVVANVLAEPIVAAAAIRESLLKQVSGSVRWDQSMQKMQALGVARMVEIGPGKVLRGLMKKINSAIPVTNAFLPEEIREAGVLLTGAPLV